ncbi:hypothetical protein ACFE04_010411 [Oxalis oulophora]
MLTKASLRKSQPLIYYHQSTTTTCRVRPLFSQAQQSSWSSSTSSSSRSLLGGDTRNGFGGDTLKSYLLRFVSSGALIVGSGLGFCYYKSETLSLDGEISNLVFADSIKEKESETEDGPIEDSGPKKKPIFLFGDDYRRRVFFNYEKRIRLQSPPEKVFEYFASFRSPTGDVLMTPADLMRAIIPVFPPSESNRIREGSLRGERTNGELHCPPSKFFMLFDTNNDGLISFAEYMFFVSLLGIPETSLSVAFKMFDLNNNGEIDREEFMKVMSLMRCQSKQVSNRDGRRFRLKSPDSVENGGIIEYLFGADGVTCLEHERFVQFLRDLHDEILQLEFAHYDYKKRGTISAKDFALSLVASADINHITKLLDRVDELTNQPELRDMRITYEEFKNFAELRKSLQSLSMAIFSYGKVNGVLTKSDFQRAASQVCGISITDNVVDIIFHVFDANRDGSLSSSEFIRVQQRREKNVMNSREAGIKGLLSCWLSCARNCSSANLLV